MPREKEFDSNADRQKAYRERRRLEEARLEHKHELPLDPSSCTSLEQYLAWHIHVAELEDDAQNSAGRTVQGPARADRVARAERYARWRWAGVRSGEVASL